MLSRSQAFAAAFSAKKALLNVNATVNAERTFTFIPSMEFAAVLRSRSEEDVRAPVEPLVQRDHHELDAQRVEESDTHRAPAPQHR